MQTFDVVTARAVADMRALAELTLPFVRPGGMLVAAKGAAPQVAHSSDARPGSTATFPSCCRQS